MGPGTSPREIRTLLSSRVPPPGGGWLRTTPMMGCNRLIDSCITQLKAQGPSRTCDESKKDVTRVRVQKLAASEDAGERARKSAIVPSGEVSRERDR